MDKDIKIIVILLVGSLMVQCGTFIIQCIK